MVGVSPQIFLAELWGFLFHGDVKTVVWIFLFLLCSTVQGWLMFSLTEY